MVDEEIENKTFNQVLKILNSTPAYPSNCYVEMADRCIKRHHLTWGHRT